MSALPTVNGPAVDLLPVTPNDSADLPAPARALRCRSDGAAGTVRITTVAGQVRNTHIDLGQLIPVQFTRVHATGTTATGLEAIV